MYLFVLIFPFEKNARPSKRWTRGFLFETGRRPYYLTGAADALC